MFTTLHVIFDKLKNIDARNTCDILRKYCYVQINNESVGSASVGFERLSDQHVQKMAPQQKKTASTKKIPAKKTDSNATVTKKMSPKKNTASKKTVARKAALKKTVAMIPFSWDLGDDDEDDDNQVRTGNTLDHFSDIFSSSSSKVNSQRNQNHLNLILSSFLVRNDNQTEHQRCGVGDATPSTGESPAQQHGGSLHSEADG